MKQDLFARDIAYEGHSDTHLSKLSERDKSTKAKTIHLTTEGVVSETDENYLKSLQRYNLVKPIKQNDENQTAGETQKRQAKKWFNQTQKHSQRDNAQTLFPYPEGCASIENIHHDNNNFVQKKHTASAKLKEKLAYLSF